MNSDFIPQSQLARWKPRIINDIFNKEYDQWSLILNVSVYGQEFQLESPARNRPLCSETNLSFAIDLSLEAQITKAKLIHPNVSYVSFGVLFSGIRNIGHSH